MSGFFDPSKVTVGISGTPIFYDGVVFAADWNTFFANLSTFLPAHHVQYLKDSLQQQIKDANQPRATESPFSQYRSKPKSKSSSSGSNKSSPDDAELPWTTGILVSGVDLDPAAHDAAEELSQTNLNRVDPVKSRLVQATPGRLSVNLVRTSEQQFRSVAGYEPALRNASVQLGKRKRAGFLPEEIILSGALQCVPCRPSNISTDIMKLFRFENFNDTPTDVYEQIKPALRLATKFISDARLLPFWATLAFGKRDRDVDIEKNPRIWQERLRSRVIPDSAASMATLNFLDLLGDHLQFHWGDTMIDGEAVFAHTLKIAGGKLIGDPWLHESVVTIHTDWYTTAKRFAALRFPDVAAVLRFHFIFASNICHEIAHAFEHKCGRMNDEKRFEAMVQQHFLTPTFLENLEIRGNEAAWLQNSYIEMGESWEVEIFGGKITPVNNRIDASLGVLTLYSSYAGADMQASLLAEEVHARTVPMAFIEEIQQQIFWDRSHNIAEPRLLLRVPKSGAEALLIPHSALMSWRSCLRERDRGLMSPLLQYIAPAVDSTTSPEGDTEPPSKRPRTIPEPDSRPTKSLAGRGTLIGRRPLQPKIKESILRHKQNAAELRKEADFAEWRTARERQADDFAKQAQEYVQPSADQTELHQYLHYRGSDEKLRTSSDSSDGSADADPALKKPEKMTTDDKWLLLEEHTLLNYGVSSSEFLARRTLKQLPYINPKYLPQNPDSWQQSQLDELIALRLQTENRTDGTGGNSFYNNRKQARAELASRRLDMVVWQEMEELAVLAGFSRIEFHHAKAARMPLPLGMSLDTWDDTWRTQLRQFRATAEFMQTPAYQAALRSGAVAPGAQGAAAAVANVADGAEVEKDQDGRGKITRYFSQEKLRDSGEEEKESEKEEKKDSKESDTLYEEEEEQLVVVAVEEKVEEKKKSSEESDTLYEDDYVEGETESSAPTERDMARLLTPRDKVLDRAEKLAQKVLKDSKTE